MIAIIMSVAIYQLPTCQFSAFRKKTITNVMSGANWQLASCLKFRICEKKNSIKFISEL